MKYLSLCYICVILINYCTSIQNMNVWLWACDKKINVPHKAIRWSIILVLNPIFAAMYFAAFILYKVYYGKDKK